MTMPLMLRKIVRYTEDTIWEGGKKAPQPLKLFAVAAVIKNPWHGQGFVEDLQPEIKSVAPELGMLLTKEMIALTGSGQTIEAYGKAAVVGTDGEVEHASALTHTLLFGNYYREAVGASSYLSFTNLRGGADCDIMIPLMHKEDAGMRSHYLTVHFSIKDAPAHDEIIVALGASIGGRPHHRIGDRYQDLEMMGKTAEDKPV